MENGHGNVRVKSALYHRRADRNGRTGQTGSRTLSAGHSMVSCISKAQRAVLLIKPFDESAQFLCNKRIS